jgi:tetratricopeptide (TPR) repeat protein
MTLRSLAAAALLGMAAVAPALHAQSVAEHVAMGDRERFSNPASALRHYEAAVVGDGRNYDALSKASITAVDVGEQRPTRRAATRSTSRESSTHGAPSRRSRPTPRDTSRWRARSAARRRTLGSRERVKYAADVRTHALEALRLDPRHPGALHVMGVWHAEIMRLSGVTRFMAKNFLGGKVFDSASWDDAQRHLEQAVAVEPNRLVHRVDLAEIYLDRKNVAKAREQVEYVLKAPATEANDAKYKRQAEALQKRM